MTEILIAPHEAEWLDLSHLPAAIAAWEASVGRKLPEIYKAFLLKYGGGSIFPSLFDVRQPPEVWGLTDFATFCDPLYDWEYAVSLWNQDTYYDSTPTDLFFIGSNPGGLEILMSLRPDDHGHIYTWWGGNQTWGEEGNTDANLYLQATDFADLIGQMYETPDGVSHDYWYTPRHALLARPLILG
jgi:SMI1-KNR4 cell-wall